jgi:hypothetical protein
MEFTQYKEMFSQVGVALTDLEIQYILDAIERADGRPVQNADSVMDYYFIHEVEVKANSRKFNLESSNLPSLPSVQVVPPITPHEKGVNITPELQEAYQKNPALVESFLKMNFPIPLVASAVIRNTSGNSASDYILRQLESSPLLIPESLQEFHQKNPQLVEELVRMSFPSELILEAVKRHSTTSAAVQYILLAEQSPTKQQPIFVVPEDRENRIEKTCGICGETFVIEELLTLNCEHRLCTDCFQGYCNSKITEAQVQETTLACPCLLSGPEVKTCLTPFSLSELKGNLSEELMTKYEKFMIRQACDAMNFRRCPRCNDWYIDVPPEALEDEEVWRSITCQACQHIFCARCGETPHKGQKEQDITCDQFATWKRENDAGEKELEKYKTEHKVQVCPACKQGAERYDGCKFMTCRCKTNFCDLCGARLNQSKHFTHFYNAPFGDKCLGLDDQIEEVPEK